MFMLRRPSAAVIDHFLSSQKRANFSYSEVGSTRSRVPAGYTVDHNRILLGRGKDVFRRAVDSLRKWRMFDLGWVQLMPRSTPVTPNATVAVLVRHFGFWSLNACRVVYVSEEKRSFRFAYGTLPDHAEKGEERFSVEWSATDDSVWYDILAFSRPQIWQARFGRPVGRLLQKKFASSSKNAMKQVVLVS